MSCARSAGVGLLFLLVASGPLRSQEAIGAADLKEAFVTSLSAAGAKMIDLAKATPPEAFSWRPTDEVRTMSEVYMHVVGNNFQFPATLGAVAPEGIDISVASPYALKIQRQDWEEDLRDKKTVVAMLEQSFRYAIGAIPQITDLHAVVSPYGFRASKLEYLFILVSHGHEHLGQAIAYARGAGVVPPWSQTAERAHPASRAEFGADGAQATIVSIDNFGNLGTDLVEEDLDRLGISLGDPVSATACGKMIEALRVDNVMDVRQGEWFAFLTPAGTLTVGRNYENASETLGCGAAETIVFHGGKSPAD